MPSPSDGRTRVPSLGPRGEGWVALQVVLIGAVFGSRLAGGDLGAAGRAAGAALGTAGLAFGGWGAGSLGRALTPLPAPRGSTADLVAHGAYRCARHPIYGGGVALAAGWSLALAPWGLVPTAALAALFELKSRVEEAWLVERFPGYEAYRRRVRGRLVPGVP